MMHDGRPQEQVPVGRVERYLHIILFEATTTSRILELTLKTELYCVNLLAVRSSTSAAQYPV